MAAHGPGHRGAVSEMTDCSATPFARRLDGIVDSARAARDVAFNTLDAVNRQTRAAADRSSEEQERDARFDPEDDQANYPEAKYPDNEASR